MDYFLETIRKHKNVYIIIISLIATILIINNFLEFAERIINNRLLLIFSLVVFYFLVYIAIKEEMKRAQIDYKTLAVFIIIVLILVIIGKFLGWW